jgi:predicted permease
MAAWVFELKQAVRAIRSDAANSALVVAIMGAGLACVIFMALVLDGLILRQLPFPAAEQLLALGTRTIGDTEQAASATFTVGTDADYFGLRSHLAAVAEVGGYTDIPVALSDRGSPEHYHAQLVSTNLLPILGVAPLLGRNFSAADGTEGAAKVVILSYDVWQARYGGDPHIVGRELHIDSVPATVIGVMPPAFGFPRHEALWLPATLVEGKNLVSADWEFNLVARRRDAANDAAVKAALASWFADARRAEPERLRTQEPVAEPLAAFAPRERLFHTLAFVAALLVQLVACANATNLLLARLLGRRQDIALRFALGASTRRITLQLLAHSALLTLIAAAVASIAALIAAQWQQAEFQLAGAAPWRQLTLDARVVLMIVGITLLSIVATAVLPAWQARRAGLSANLRDGASGAGGGSFTRVSRVLVVAAIALSAMLLIGGAVMLRAMQAMQRAPLGIQRQQLLTAKFDLPSNRYGSDVAQLAFYRALTDALRAEPGVVDATVGQVQPGVWADTRDIVADGAERADAAAASVNYGAVDAHALSTFGVPLRKGRFFDDRDTAAGLRVAVVDAAFERAFGAGQPILGRRFRLDPSDAGDTPVTVVGVTDPVNLTSPHDAQRPALFVPLAQAVNRYGIVTLRTRGQPSAFAPRLAEVMRALDADVPLYFIRDYPSIDRENSAAERRASAWFGVAACVALMIAATGLYGVLAFAVSRRTREIGVRRALGASGSRILRDVGARSAAQVALGLLLGVALGNPFAQLMARYAGTVAVHDARIVPCVTGILLLAAVLATWMPLRKALQVAPLVAIRHE